MTRGSACSYHDCGQGLLSHGRALSKSQKNHVSGHHLDIPITFICRHSDRPATFNRQSGKGMDFVCFCGLRFTLNSSLQRHYQLCLVARDTVLQTLNTMPQVKVQAPSEGEVVPQNSSSSSSSISISRGPTSVVPVVETTTGQRLEEKMIERHQIFLETFTEHTTAQHTKFIASMTENHMTFLQAFTSAQVQQNASLQRVLANQHHEAFEQQRVYLDNQRRIQEELLSEQKLTRTAVRNFMSTKRERSFTLEVDEQALKRIQKDPAYVVRRSM